ncbi:ABC transporter permease [Paenibacillus caui]|uniref:ABC transporter permease n=1 Tax=Paenibacillus caui TaxID=2873927 RepID=UPI001CA88D1C|nr:DUF2705 family protein [Paenibacillus caui]
MANFFKLLKNENMKIYRRLRTWIMMGLVVIIPALVAVLMAVSTGGDTEIGAWDAFTNLTSLFFLVSIFSAIIFADIVASEFTWGTIKLLLIRPWKRSKVLLSKLLAGLIFSLLLTLIFIVVNWALSFLLFKNISTPGVYPAGYSPFSFNLEMLLYRYVDMVIICIFAFMLSTLFRSSGIAIGLAIFLLFAGNILQALLRPEKYAWTKYVLFTNMNLSRYMIGDGSAAGMTLGFSVAVLSVYVIVFLAVSWIVFMRRDVAA